MISRQHMLFLGTKPYPQEDSFESFLSSNGGSSNAFTDSLDTVYYFDLNADGDAKFAEALQRFGAFFSEPLFTEAGMYGLCCVVLNAWKASILCACLLRFVSFFSFSVCLFVCLLAYLLFCSHGT